MYVESRQSIAAAAVAAPSSQVFWEKVEGFTGYKPDTKVEPQRSDRPSRSYRLPQWGAKPLNDWFLVFNAQSATNITCGQNTSLQIKSLIHVHITWQLMGMGGNGNEWTEMA